MLDTVIEVVPCEDGSIDFVMGYDIVGSASNLENAINMLVSLEMRYVDLLLRKVRDHLFMDGERTLH